MDTSETYIKQCERAEEIQKTKISKDDVVTACPKHVCLIQCYHSEDTGGDSFTEYYCPVYMELEDVARRRIYVIADKDVIPIKFIDTTENMNRRMNEFRVVNECKEEEWVWLPRQDELQAMVTERVNCSPSYDVCLAYMFHKWMTEQDGYLFGFDKAPLPKPSMEQLWLGFVMFERFGKIWSGTDWVNGN